MRSDLEDLFLYVQLTLAAEFTLVLLLLSAVRGAWPTLAVPTYVV